LDPNAPSSSFGESTISFFGEKNDRKINHGWWYTYPSEKYESHLGLLFPQKGTLSVPTFTHVWMDEVKINIKKKNSVKQCYIYGICTNEYIMLLKKMIEGHLAIT